MAEPENPLLIVAGKYREAEYYARRWSLGPKEWDWVKSPEDVFGKFDREVVFAGSFSNRAQEVREIGEYIKTHGMKYRYEPEIPYEMPTD